MMQKKIAAGLAVLLAAGTILANMKFFNTNNCKNKVCSHSQ